ncbi:MAG: 3-oxoacyl-(acyl-carrier-protein) reductase FabG [Syntrophorhabdaceae bacterium PtaU1.Bin034]|nr:MAG: 3-oxoacyl-(acyl-carrier-protein) reductase FabG [Syntrophorhabdaceae bacterium PtaU1.Bin034]
MKLKDRVALVTGAGSGLGRAIAVHLAKEGARIGINDISAKGIDDTLALLKGLGASGLALQADVGNSAEVRGMFEKLQAAYGTIDILVNNAGIAIPSSWPAYQKLSNDVALKATTEVMETGKMQESMKVTSSFEDE